MNDCKLLEKVQRKAARWARGHGQYGIVPVTDILKDLGWAELTQRRRNQRLVLVYKIIQDLIAVPPESVDIVLNTRSTRYKHSKQIRRVVGGDISSPLHKGTIFRTVPQWNKLPAHIAETESLDSFKDQLARHP